MIVEDQNDYDVIDKNNESPIVVDQIIADDVTSDVVSGYESDP